MICICDTCADLAFAAKRHASNRRSHARSIHVALHTRRAPQAGAVAAAEGLAGLRVHVILRAVVH